MHHAHPAAFQLFLLHIKHGVHTLLLLIIASACPLNEGYTRMPVHVCCFEHMTMSAICRYIVGHAAFEGRGLQPQLHAHPRQESIHSHNQNQHVPGARIWHALMHEMHASTPPYIGCTPIRMKAVLSRLGQEARGDYTSWHDVALMCQHHVDDGEVV